jgi:hypothetical protein
MKKVKYKEVDFVVSRGKKLSRGLTAWNGKSYIRVGRAVLQ